MGYLALPTALNLLWAAMMLSAATALVVWDWRRDGGRSHALRARRLCAVLLLSLCLFPSVSSSDDLFSFSLIDSQMGRSGEIGSSPAEDSGNADSATFIHVLNVLEHFQSEAVWIFVLTLFAVGTIACTRFVLICRPAIAGSSRAPPLA
jgi:hypothetical protein